MVADVTRHNDNLSGSKIVNEAAVIVPSKILTNRRTVIITN